MHRNIIITLIIIISVNFANAQSLFNNRYDIEKGAEVTGKMVYYNNQYILTGRAIDSMIYYSFPPPNAKIGIIGINNIGQKLYAKKYGNPIYDYGSSWGKVVIFNKNFYKNGVYMDSLGKGHQYLFKFNEQGDSLLLIHYFENDTSVEYWGGSCKATRDSNIVLCGVVDSSSFNNYSQMYIMKVDTLGSILWTKTYGGNNYESCTNMDTCSDGGFVLGGWTTSYGGSDQDPYIIKTDSNGNFQWDKTINTNSYNDWPAVVIGTKDGGILAVTTEVQSQPATSSKHTKIFYNKYDINGNLLWRKSIGDTLLNLSVFSVKEFENGDIAAVATAKFYNVLFKLNANGDSLLMQTFYWIKGDCSVYNQYAFDMSLIDNDGFAITGFVIPSAPGSTVNNSQDAWLATFDSLGCQLPNRPYNLTANISYTATDTIVDLNWDYNSTSPNELFIVEKYLHEYYAWDFLHMNCLSSGLYLGNIPIPNTYFTDTLTERTKTKYRVFAVDTVTHRMSCHSNVVTIDLTNAIIETEQEEAVVRVYPNPTSNSFNVAYDFANVEDGEFILYSLEGKLLIQTSLPKTQNMITVNTASLNNGVYFYTVYNSGSFVANGKLVVLR